MMTLGSDNQLEVTVIDEPGRTPANDTSCQQEEVIRFLSSKRAFGQLPDERIDTHISHVFLVGRHAYKLKRAVKLEFLDFTSLESRRIACEREVEINRRTAPDVYLGVTPVIRNGNSFHFDGDGEVVDYLVMMNRFDDKTLFNRLYEKGDLKEPLITDLAEQLAKLHLGAETRRDFGGAESVEHTMTGVARTLMEFDGDVFLKGSVAKWKLRMEAELLRQSRRLDMRRRAGFVRQCHGDLHLGNICLVNGRPTPFDAIEFGDEYSVIDVLYDLAFPVMDLVCVGASSHANVLLCRYLELTGDYSGLHVLPLFMSLRAGVRAMVHALSSRGAHGDETTRMTARAYFDLAGTYPQSSEPKLLAVGGVSGTGKSTLARRLATCEFPREGAVVIRSDAVRKHLFHHPALVPLPKGAYSLGTNVRVFRALCRDAHRALRSGYSVVVDATFLDEKRRRQLEDVATRRQVPFCGLWLDADKDTLIARVSARTSDVSDADREVIRSQLERGAGEVTWTRVDANGTPDGVLGLARAVIRENL